MWIEISSLILITKARDHSIVSQEQKNLRSSDYTARVMEIPITQTFGVSNECDSYLVVDVRGIALEQYYRRILHTSWVMKLYPSSLFMLLNFGCLIYC